MGKRIAAHAAAKSLVRGSLIVEVEDGIWQKHLFYLRFQILAKLQEVLGSGHHHRRRVSRRDAAPAATTGAEPERFEAD